MCKILLNCFLQEEKDRKKSTSRFSSRRKEEGRKLDDSGQKSVENFNCNTGGNYSNTTINIQNDLAFWPATLKFTNFKILKKEVLEDFLENLPLFIDFK